MRRGYHNFSPSASIRSALRIGAIFVLFGQPSFLDAQQKDPNIADTPPLTAAEQLEKFHLPPGFVMELVAAEPDINKPINIAFDSRGRLWVTESVEYPFPAEKDKKPRDRVKILSDFAADGRARKTTTYADELNIPVGVLPLPGGEGALVYSIPNIFRMSGADTAEKREVLYSGYGFGDTHGMTGEFLHGFDGWIYCCHGYANTSKVKGKGGESITMTSGNTYRIKADGSRIEYFTHGQVNPFGLTIDEAGNIYSSDCHSRPIYQLLKGAWYPSFEKPHDGLGFGPEMMRHDHGSTAIAGIAYYADEHWPAEYRGNIFVGNVVTNRINRDRLEWKGSSPKAIEMPDLVKCDDPWFRPVDIKLGADGNLYVADFYNRIIGHYEVPLDHPGRDREKGRIWRIRYVGDKGQVEQRKPFDFVSMKTADLVNYMSNINLTARMMAMHELVHRANADADGLAEIAKLTKKAVEEGTQNQMIHGLWVLERLGKLEDLTLLNCVDNTRNILRIHGMRILAEREKWTEKNRNLVVACLADADPMVQRVAAEALAAHPEARNVEPLLALLHKAPAQDTHFVHVVRMALRDQLKPKETWTALADKKWEDHDARALADVCLGARTLETAQYLMGYVEKQRGAALSLDHAKYIARYGPEGASSWVINIAGDRHANDLERQGRIFLAVQLATQERGGALTKQCQVQVEDLTLKLLDGAVGQMQVGIALADALRLPAAMPKLLDLVKNTRTEEAMRKSALVALLAIEPHKNTATLAQLLNDPKEPIALREQVATSLAATNHAEAHGVLIAALESAPAPLQTTIALGMAGSKQGAEKLLEAVAAGKASARLLQERPIELRLRQSKIRGVEDRLAKLTHGLPAADVRMQKLLDDRRAGFQKAKADPEVGAKVFQNHCAACHQIGNKGAKIAPQLDGVGIRGLDRLLEDTLDPNRNVDQAFRSTTLILGNGQFITGLFLREEGQVLIMADAQGKEIRVPKKSVEERITTNLSPMPGNFAEMIPEEEFYHLLAYLLAQRVKD